MKHLQYFLDNVNNTLGFVPLNTHEVAQFYIDLVRPYVDVVVMLTHLGLESDQDMIQNTTGIDVVMGGHNHIVISPSQKLQDWVDDFRSLSADAS